MNAYDMKFGFLCGDPLLCDILYTSRKYLVFYIYIYIDHKASVPMELPLSEAKLLCIQC